MMSRKPNLYWYELDWQRPFELERVYEVYTHLAATTPRGPIVWEVRGNKNGIRFLIGIDGMFASRVKSVFSTHGDIRFAELTDGNPRVDVVSARQIKITKPILSLKTDTTLATIRAGLAVINNAPKDTEVVLQVILGMSFSPKPAPSKMQDPYASWFSVAVGSVKEASKESLSSVKDKVSQHGFASAIRIGISEGAPRGYFFNILSAFKTLEMAGVSISQSSEKPENINNAHIPWHFPLRLSIKELATFLLLPVGDTELPGVAGLHPKTVLPPRWYKSPDEQKPEENRTFAMNGNTALSISPKDALEHTIILGPIGSGKSTTMLNLIQADIDNGRSVLVVDQKNDLVNDVLARIPTERYDDVVILDPSEPSPAGFNPFALKVFDKKPELVQDALFSVFMEIFSENMGIRSKDVLSAAFLTLAQTKGTTLLSLLPLLTNENYRRSITSKINDKIGLEPFWEAFEEMGDRERNVEVAPSLNKLRQFLLRPGLRNMIGQVNPKFDFTELFTSKKIVLVPLNKGVIGAECAKLLGSLIFSMTWTLALSRANIPEDQREPVSVFIDEFHDYLALNTSLSDMLVQARALKLGLTLAHQHRGQLSPDIRAAVDANARNKIIFGLNASDAKDMAAMSTELTPQDFMTLERYHIYTSFNAGGRNVGWVSGRTLPSSDELQETAEIRAKSMSKYGCPASEVDQEYLSLIRPQNDNEINFGEIGRKKI